MAGKKARKAAKATKGTKVVTFSEAKWKRLVSALKEANRQLGTTATALRKAQGAINVVLETKPGGPGNVRNDPGTQR